MLAAVFSGCGGTSEPATTTVQQTSAATSASAETTAAVTTTVQTTTEATTTEAAPKYEGYEFILANCDKEWTDSPSSDLEQELVDNYYALEDELGCTFSFIGLQDENQALLVSGMSGDKIADFIKVKQMAWGPAAVGNYLRPLNSDEVKATGMDINDENLFDQVYTQMANLGDNNVWAVSFSGKYFVQNFGFTYIFNKQLCANAGYPTDELYQTIYDRKFTWDVFKDICRKVSVDSDNDGNWDYFGLTMVDGESELASNKINIMYQGEDGKWISGFMNPYFQKSLQFVIEISLDQTISMQDAAVGAGGNDFRRQTFYDGKAAFACLYGAHYGKDGINSRMEEDYGLAPIPMGPDAEEYSHIIPDLKAFCVQTANKDWQTSCEIMVYVADMLTDKEAANETLASYFRDEQSLDILTNILLPNAQIQATRFSPDIKEALNEGVTIILTQGAGAIEQVDNLMQTAINNLFGY